MRAEATLLLLPFSGEGIKTRKLLNFLSKEDRRRARAAAPKSRSWGLEDRREEEQRLVGERGKGRRIEEEQEKEEEEEEGREEKKGGREGERGGGSNIRHDHHYCIITLRA